MTFADLLYKGVVKVGKIMLKRKYGELPAVFGRENIPEPPYIVVANYLELFEGPMAAINAIPVRLYPWTANIWMDRQKAVRQSKRTFRPRIGNDILLNIAATAWGIGYSWLHNYGESIPIYRSKDYKKGDPRLRDTLNETFELSVDALLEGKSLLIMPEERAGKPDKNHLWKFKPGAANVAKHYFEREGDLPELKYVLVGVSFKTGDVSIDNVVLEDFPGDNKSISELKSRLENTIQDMCTEMNKE